MQAFTQGAVTIQVEIVEVMPIVGPMMGGYSSDFVWWLSIDGVEYVSGETARVEDWFTEKSGGSEGWDLDSVMDRLDDVDFDTHGDIDAVVDLVLQWFNSISEEIVSAWTNVVSEYVERANEHADFLPRSMQDV